LRPSQLIAWIASTAAVCIGIFVLRSSFESYRLWQEYLAMGDFSGAELPEIEFWVKVLVSLLLILVGAFSAGRLSRRG
jgi:hypothetical protein